MHQLALPLTQRRAPPRQQPVIERLFAVLKRQGFDTHWRALKGSTLIRPSLTTRAGYEPMCGFYSCGSFTFERAEGYCDREPLTREEREAWARWREEVYRLGVYAEWGRP